jgi:glycosyltransferase involved in cell wall biosynthesis
MCRAVAEVDDNIAITIVTTSYGLTPDWLAEVQQRLPASTELRVFSQIGAHTTSISPSLIWWIWRHAAEFDVLHIHALFHPISTAAAAIAAARGVPYVLRPLGTLSPYTFAHRRTKLKEMYFRFVDSRLINRAAALHFTAPQEATKAARLGLRAPRVIVPLPYRGDEFVARSESPGVILFMARLHPGKGLDILMPAFARVLASGARAHLTIAGSGAPAYETQIRQRLRELGIERETTLAGFVEGETKRELLRGAAIFVLPSHQENFGMSVVEAMGAGVPVIVSDQVDLWPDVIEYDAGLVTPLTIEAFADAMTLALQSGDRRRRYGEGGRRLVSERYAPGVVGRALSAMYVRATESP